MEEFFSECGGLGVGSTTRNSALSSDKVLKKSDKSAPLSFDTVLKKSDKSLLDNWHYGVKTFANGLRYLAVQLPRTGKAGIAVAVREGSLGDPRDFPGLAHLTEHSVFTGSKHYPSKTG